MRLSSGKAVWPLGTIPALLRVACGVFVLLGLHAASAQQTTRATRRTAREISGVYVLGSEGHSLAALEPYLKNPSIDGFSLRAGWKDIEPQEGTYDWSLFDPLIAEAARQSKKIMLRVLPGVKTPEWVYAAGAARFDFTDVNPYHPTAGETLAIPVPWDPVYLKKWLHFVAAFGAKYSGQPAVTIVAITGPSAGGEMHLVDKDNAERWHAAGYSDATLADTWKQVIGAFAAAFPRQHLAVAIAKPVNFDDPREAVERVVRACAEAGCGIQGNWLAAKTRPQNPLYRRVAAHSAISPVGFQMLSAAGISRFGGDLRAAVDLALRARACYLEIYPADLARYPVDVAYAHEQLTRAGK